MNRQHTPLLLNQDIYVRTTMLNFIDYTATYSLNGAQQDKMINSLKRAENVVDVSSVFL